MFFPNTPKFYGNYLTYFPILNFSVTLPGKSFKF